MKHAKTVLAALAAAALALAVLAGCSGSLAGIAKEDPEQGRKLMEKLDPELTCDSSLEKTARQLADWLVEDPDQLGVQSGMLFRKVELTADSGNMMDTNVNDFIDHSSISSDVWVNIPRSVTIGLALDNQSRAFTGYLYAPSLDDAARSLSDGAKGCSRMGSVFIEYAGTTYVVALFA